MKKLVLTCAFITTASIVFAQAPHAQPQNAQAHAPVASSTRAMPSPEQLAERRAKTYQANLGLNPDQYKKVYDAELEYAKADQYFRANGQEVPAGPAQQMMMTHDQKLQAALTPEQYTKYEKVRLVRPVGSTPAATTH